MLQTDSNDKASTFYLVSEKKPVNALYIRYSHTYLIKKTAVNVIFEAAKVQR